jgi:PAS domain S-box-containing protein
MQMLPDSSAVHQELQQLRRLLADTVASRDRIQDALDLRNAALDAATTQFMIVDVRDERRPIVYVNRALAAQHGYDRPADLLGRSVATLVERIADNDTHRSLREQLDAGFKVAAEIQMSRGDGSLFWVGFSTTPLRNAAGEITHHVTLGADITARRENDRKGRQLQEQLIAEMRERERMGTELQLAQKLESVGRLAAGLAHEINTPIQYVGDSVHFLQSAFESLAGLFAAYRTAMTGAAGDETMADRVDRLRAMELDCDLDFLSQEVPKAFERTLEGTERVAVIVRAMKEFAYPDVSEHAPADLNHALQTTLIVARSEYKQVACIDTQLGELPAVTCNVGELNQVFLNLIINAAHAIEDSGKDASKGRISIVTQVLDGMLEDMAQITICDNGCGIPAANLEKIFDPFYTTKEVGRGTGQGLAIARSIVVDRHGGRIEVSSTPGEGTRFVILLPVHGRTAQAVA